MAKETVRERFQEREEGVCSPRHVGTLGRRETDTDLCGVEAYVCCDN